MKTQLLSTTFIRMVHCLFPIILSSFFSGCASMTSDPWLKDVLTHPEEEKFEDETKTMRLSYIARAAMESDNRAEIESEVAKSELVREWSAADYSIAAQMGTDLAVGSISSAQGHAIGNAVFVGTAVLGEIFDGAMDKAGQIYIPEEFYDIKIDSKEVVESFIDKFGYEQMNALAEAQDWKLSCLDGCLSKRQIMLLEHNGLPTHYLYKPKEIIAVIDRSGIVEIPEDDPINAVLGFNAKWSTELGNTYIVRFYAEPTRDNEGNILIKTNSDGITYPVVKRDLHETHIGRDLERTFHSTPYTYTVDQDAYPHYFFYNKEFYWFISNSRTDLIRHVVNEPNLLLPITKEISLQKTIAKN